VNLFSRFIAFFKHAGIPYPKMAAGNHRFSVRVADAINRQLLRHGEFIYGMAFITDETGKLVDSSSYLELESARRKSVIYSPKDRDVQIRNELNRKIRDEIFADEIDAADGFYRLDVNYKNGLLYCSSITSMQGIEHAVIKTMEEVCQES